METALNDTQGAIKYILDGFEEHPNRVDITEGNVGPGATPNQPSGSTPFGQIQQPSAPSPFGQAGQPSAPGAFGQPAQNPSPFGQTQQSGFGQPSTLGSGSAFGQTSGLGGGGGFGKPSFGSSGFGNTNTASSFAKAPFGQPSAPSANPFGGATNSSPFSQINQSTNPSPFSNPSTAPQNPSPFGQPQQPAGPSPFGQPSTLGGPSPFGQPQKPSPSPFGQPTGASSFQLPGVAPGQNQSPFSQMQQTQQGQPAQPAQSNPFGQPQASSKPFGGSNSTAAPQGVPLSSNQDAGPPVFMDLDGSNDLNPLPRLQGESRRDPVSNRISMWKGRPVQYMNDHPCYLHPQDNKTWVRINFPNGPPDAASLRDSQAKEDQYTPEVVSKYKYFLEHGKFENGEIPAVPPPKDCISFDF